MCNTMASGISIRSAGRMRNGANYVSPAGPDKPFAQGFDIAVHRDGRTVERSLDGDGEGLPALVELPPVHSGGSVSEVDASVACQITW